MFEKRFLADDIRAGMVVFLVALPLCLGIALAFGALSPGAIVVTLLSLAILLLWRHPSFK